MSELCFDATIPGMDTTARSSRPEATSRHGLRYIISRLVRRARSQRGERGAVVLEFAIILPLLITITFGIVEFSDAFHDSAITSDAARAGGRVGSALATNPAYTTSIVDAVNAALSTLPADSPQELWIYKANVNGYPGAGTSFSSCAANCIRYLWNTNTKSFDAGAPLGGGWPASTHQVCTQPFDELGVYVKINHKFVTGLFGANVTLTDHSVFRFEPVPTSVCSS
jgi:Flp pilus assembly protein TadG